VQRLQGRRLRTPLRNVSFLHVFLVVFQIDVYVCSAVFWLVFNFVQF
jgi:hypothetical protein